MLTLLYTPSERALASVSGAANQEGYVSRWIILNYGHKDLDSRC
jgi:hypothetical protein